MAFIKHPWETHRSFVVCCTGFRYCVIGHMAEGWCEKPRYVYAVKSQSLWLKRKEKKKKRNPDRWGDARNLLIRSSLKNTHIMNEQMRRQGTVSCSSFPSFIFFSPPYPLASSSLFSALSRAVPSMTSATQLDRNNAFCCSGAFV